MIKDEALRLALEALEYEAQKGNDNAYQFEREAIKAALEANEFNPDWDTQAVLVEEIQRMAKRIEELEAKDEPVGWAEHGVINWLADKQFNHTSFLYATPSQRTWVGLTPACPKGLTQYECELEGVDLVCFLEYTPDEEGSRDSYGLLNEPGTSENLELVNAYVKGTDIDIGHLLLQYLVDHITTTALEDFKNDDY